VNETSATNTITVDDLTPGSRYTFTVTATSSQGLGSNNITCINTTGVLLYDKRNVSMRSVSY